MDLETQVQRNFAKATEEARTLVNNRKIANAVSSANNLKIAEQSMNDIGSMGSHALNAASADNVEAKVNGSADGGEEGAEEEAAVEEPKIGEESYVLLLGPKTV